MAPWPVTVFVGAILLIFSIAMLSFAICIGALLVVRIAGDVYHLRWKSMPATAGTAALIGMFAYLFGSGAYNLASQIIDGFVARFL